MNKLLICLIAVAAISLSAPESSAQYYRGGRGVSVGFGGFNSGFGGYNGFNRGFGGSGVSINIGGGGFNRYGGGFNNFNRGGFYGGGVPYYSARPVYYSAPVYRGGYYGGGYRSYGGRSCGY